MCHRRSHIHVSYEEEDTLFMQRKRRVCSNIHVSCSIYIYIYIHLYIYIYTYIEIEAKTAHMCHMRRRIHVSYEEEVSYEEGDTCVT